MVELTTGQGHDGHTEIGDVTIRLGGVSAQGTTKLTIEVVFPTLATLGENLDGFVAEEPDANISQEVMIFLNLCQRLDGGFLEHLFQH